MEWACPLKDILHVCLLSLLILRSGMLNRTLSHIWWRLQLQKEFCSENNHLLWMCTFMHGCSYTYASMNVHMNACMYVCIQVYKVSIPIHYTHISHDKEQIWLLHCKCKSHSHYATWAFLHISAQNTIICGISTVAEIFSKQNTCVVD